MMQPENRIKRRIRYHAHMPPAPRHAMHGIMHALDAAIDAWLALVPLVVAERAVAAVGAHKVEDQLAQVADLLLQGSFGAVVLGGGAVGERVADGGGVGGKGVGADGTTASLKEGFC